MQNEFSQVFISGYLLSLGFLFYLAMIFYFQGFVFSFLSLLISSVDLV